MIVIDGRESSLSLSNYGNLEEVLSKIMEDEAFGERIVTDVLVDDEAFSELYPHQAEDIDADSFSRLELRTISLNDMASEVLVELPKVIDIMAHGSKRVAELFRQSELADGLEMLQDIVAVSRDMLGTIDVLRANYSAGKMVELDALGDSLGSLLDELGDAMEDEDWMLVADLIEYEFLPACDGWRSVISIIDAAVEDARAA